MDLSACESTPKFKHECELTSAAIFLDQVAGLLPITNKGINEKLKSCNNATAQNQLIHSLPLARKRKLVRDSSNR